MNLLHETLANRSVTNSAKAKALAGLALETVDSRPDRAQMYATLSVTYATLALRGAD